MESYDLDLDTLPDDLLDLYEIVGEDLLNEIIDAMPGQSIYIPDRKTLDRDRIYEDIRKEYDGRNAKALAAKYGYSARHIRTIATRKVETFTCPDCGQITEQNGSGNRKRCAACAYKRRRELEKLRRTGDSYVYKGKPKVKAENQPQEKAPDPVALQRKRDAELDARSAQQIELQCCRCEYAYRAHPAAPAQFCDFVSWRGRLRNRGDGPGDCRDFAPVGTLTREERLARRRDGIAMAETDCGR